MDGIPNRNKGEACRKRVIHAAEMAVPSPRRLCNEWKGLGGTT